MKVNVPPTMKRISMAETARRFANEETNLVEEHIKAAAKEIFPKVYSYIKTREQTHDIVSKADDSMTLRGDKCIQRRNAGRVHVPG